MVVNKYDIGIGTFILKKMRDILYPYTVRPVFVCAKCCLPPQDVEYCKVFYIIHVIFDNDYYILLYLYNI
jgi:hypothetical protein